MSKRLNPIENLDEQIKKLENNVYNPEKEEIEILDESDTSTAEDLDDTDTKIFNGEEVVKEDEADTLKEEVSSDTKIIENIDEEEQIVPSKKSKTKIILIVLICLIVLGGIITGVFLYFNSDRNDVEPEEEIEEKLTDEEKKKLINNYGVALEGVINVYYTNQKVLLEYDDATKLVEFEDTISCRTHEIYDNGKIYLDKCSINGVLTKYSYGVKQEKVEVSEDELLYVYVNKKNNIATLSKPKDENQYDKYTVHCGGVYSEPILLANYGDYVFYYDSEYNIQMKNYRTDEMVLSGINYKAVLPIRIAEDTYDSNLLAVNINDFWGIYNISTNEQVISPMYSGFISLTYGYIGPVNSVQTIGNNLIGAWDGKSFGLINYTNNNIVIPFEYNYMYKSGNYIWATGNDENKYIYDFAGNKYLTDGYHEVYGIVDGIYVLVRQDKNIKMVQIDGKVLYDYGEIENIGSVNFSISYNDGALFQFFDESYETGCVEVIYNNKEKTGEIKEGICGGIAKPILYLYPKKKTDVTITFSHPEFLETTYPKFTGKWEVEANKDGSLYDKNGNYYYALYWDEKKVHPVDFSEGFYVEKDEAIEFLEEKLSYIGLNDKERNEFIMYWLPILEKNEKNLVYFELTEERESYNKINIKPKPDSLLRVVIHVKKVDKKVNIKKQSLVKVQRKGFVAVEWGGTTY